MTARRFLARATAAFVFGMTFYVAARRSVADFMLVFHDAPRSIVPEEHRRQIVIFRTQVPAGSIVYYLMDKREAWQAGLWQRSLYPDYGVRQVVGLEEFRTDQTLRAGVNGLIEFVISAGTPPLDPSFEWKVALPNYPGGIPIVFGRVRSQ